MERNRQRFRQVHPCPVLCITKALLFIICAVLLCLPLGDPKEKCFPKGHEQENVALYCLCNYYELFQKTASEVKNIADALLCATLQALYDLKLKFYYLLGTIDREDLCRSICCLDDEENSPNKEKRSRCTCLGSCDRKSQK